MKILLLKIFGGCVLVSALIIGSALYTDQSAGTIALKIESVNFQGLTGKGIDLEVTMKGSWNTMKEAGPTNRAQLM